MNPKKRKHQETPAEELWKGESSARGSWQEKDAGWEERHPDWEQDRDASYEKEKEKLMRRDELTAFNHAHVQAVERARRMDACRRDQLTAPPAWTQATSADIAAVAVFVHEGIRNLKDQQAQYEASLKLGSTEIQGGADQLGGFGNAWHENWQLNANWRPRPVPHPIACTGAARTRRAHREFAVAAGTTNPHKEDMKRAERQLRQSQKSGKSNDICLVAKNKIRYFHEKVGLWDHQQTNLEGTPLTEFAKQSIAAAAEEYATSKFSEGPG